MIGFDPRRLEAFVAFAETRSFTTAARRVGVTQPALHMQVTKLADELGVQLYRRIGRRIELTDQGKRVAAFGRDLVRGAGDLMADLAVTDAARPIVLATGEATLRHLLLPSLARFVSSQKCALSLVTRGRDATLEAVRTGEADLGVAPVDQPPAGWQAWLLAETAQHLVLPRQHPLACRRNLAPTDLDGVPMVVPPVGGPHRVAIEEALRGCGARFCPVVEVAGWDLMVEMVALGLGVAIINTHVPFGKALVGRPIRGFPPQRFRVLARNAPITGSPLAALRDELLAGTRAMREP